MKDYLGNDLQVGDEVVYVELGYRNFKKGKIARFTAKFVFIKEGKSMEIKQKPEQLIKIIKNEN